ncbi:phosphotransferase [Micromonospora sp. WMMD1076]|uniref:phosphotransferase family protein n=1 Tax=Micromonospora sp. WMMD1076 TaxID=3016103 RepID=UPI002499ED75|nr:phosphotransferase [Micromonospora sp. WMMD1076]WFF08193.1 phosphotransferase [Micromonospora sp. WMMD1076]
MPETEANEWPVVDERMLAAEVAWSVDVVDLVFMPIGLDGHAWAYRVETSDGRRYFLKVRRGDFTPAAFLLPGFLWAQGLREVVAPLDPSPRWRGRTSVRGLSTTALLVSRRRRPVGRAARSDALNAFWERYGTALHRLAETVDDLASRVTPGQRVICQADIHRGNLIVDGDGPLHVVDWDAPILAPRERDLVFVHSADFGDHPINAHRAELFREGYGALEPDQSC